MRPAAAILIAAAIVLAGAGDADGAGWSAPVRGPVTRGFDVGPNPFAGGQHRGADFGARPGAAVRAACGGRVLVAGRVGTSGRVVTIGCGPWRVTHMPLAGVAVRRGASVRRGTRLGTVAAGAAHRGLHLGVRRDGRRFGYVDPLRFLGAAAPPPIVAGPRPSRPVRRPLSLQPSPELRPAPGSSPVLARVRPAAAPGGDGVAPWFVWAGLALLLVGGIGAGVRRAPRRGRASLPRPVAQEVR